MDAEAWDARYRGTEQLFSGNPNGALFDEIDGVSPGRALDVVQALLMVAFVSVAVFLGRRSA